MSLHARDTRRGGGAWRLARPDVPGRPVDRRTKLARRKCSIWPRTFACPAAGVRRRKKESRKRGGRPATSVDGNLGGVASLALDLLREAPSREDAVQRSPLVRNAAMAAHHLPVTTRYFALVSRSGRDRRLRSRSVDEARCGGGSVRGTEASLSSASGGAEGGAAANRKGRDRVTAGVRIPAHRPDVSGTANRSDSRGARPLTGVAQRNRGRPECECGRELRHRPLRACARTVSGARRKSAPSRSRHKGAAVGKGASTSRSGRESEERPCARPSASRGARQPAPGRRRGGPAAKPCELHGDPPPPSEILEGASSKRRARCAHRDIRARRDEALRRTPELGGGQRVGARKPAGARARGQSMARASGGRRR